MKKLFVFLIVLCLMSFTTVNAQKCKVGKDPFTGEKTVSSDFSHRTIYFEYKGDKIHMELKFTYKGQLHTDIPTGTEILFKLENDEILKFAIVEDAPPKTKVGHDNAGYSYVTTDYSFVMLVSKDELNKMASSKVVLIRYPDAQGGTLDYTPKGLGKILTNAIYKCANCIKDNL